MKAVPFIILQPTNAENVSFGVHKVYFKPEKKMWSSKLTISWVHCSEFNCVCNRPSVRSKVIVAFAAEWMSATEREKEGSGDGYL